MPYWFCHYHVVWATYRRAPLITSLLEPVVHQWILDKSALLKCQILAMNGTEDHIHVAVTIPPMLAVTEWVRHVKGVSAYEINSFFPDLPEQFKWQSGYGVITVGPKHLPRVIEYITNQKTHHANHSIIPSLERTDDNDIQQ